jgi:beta-1,4-N-acetylglucosaminyltransferase
MKILLVCSSGGHFKAIQQLRPFWQDHDRTWITFKTVTTEAALTDETVHWAYSPTNRNLPNLVRNLGLALKVLISKDRPDLIISTGAGVAVPFVILGRLRGSQTIFIESVTRVTSLSLSAKLALPFLSALYVHWPQLQRLYPKAELIGSSQGE